MSFKIAIVISHPVQHFCPMYASWAKVAGVQVKVFFGSNLGAVKYLDPNFKKEISWSNLYLNEFEHEFLNGDKTLQSTPTLDAPNLNDRLTNFQPNVVVHYGYYHLLAKHARAWAIQNKIPLAYISDAEHRQQRPWWKEALKYPYLYWFFKKENLFLTVGSANEAYYTHYKVAKQKLLRMNFSIDVLSYDEAFTNKEQISKNFKAEHNIGNNDFVISVVGKLVSWKSQDDLIRLLIDLEKTQPNKTFHLLIAGSGPLENEWKNLAKSVTKNKVHFLGFVNPANLPAIYAASNVYIHPALIEPHSLSISEAIYMGSPVIVANTTGSWGEVDDVQQNKNGYVYEHGNLQQLQDCLLRMINENKQQEFSEYSLKISREFQRQSHQQIVTDLMNLFSNKVG